MSRLPVLSGHKLIKILMKNGFIPSRQKGSHVLLRHPKKRSIVVPLHKEIDKGTLIEIIRQAKLSRKELLKFLKR